MLDRRLYHAIMKFSWHNGNTCTPNSWPRVVVKHYTECSTSTSSWSLQTHSGVELENEPPTGFCKLPELNTSIWQYGGIQSTCVFSRLVLQTPCWWDKLFAYRALVRQMKKGRWRKKISDQTDEWKSGTEERVDVIERNSKDVSIKWYLGGENVGRISFNMI